jgi:hypothetical protein
MTGFIGRREFISLLGGAATWPLGARPQQPSMPVIGFLDAGSAAARTQQVAAFRKGLAEAGFQEGQNIALEFRWAEGQYGRFSELARIVRGSIRPIRRAIRRYAATYRWTLARSRSLFARLPPAGKSTRRSLE